MPFSDVRENPDSLKLLESWLKSYEPQELFDANGRLIQELRELAPERRAAHERQPACQRRAAAQGPEASRLPRSTPSRSRPRGAVRHENTKPLGEFLRDVMRANMTSFRVFGPDETASNRLQAIYEVIEEDLDGATCCRRTPTAASCRATGA